MEKVIWIIGSNRAEMIEAQRKINSIGSMRALCLLSFEALQKVTAYQGVAESSRISTPSLMILDYEMSRQENFRSLSFLNNQQALAGVPLFFMVEERNEDLDEECYSRGAMVVLHKPFSKSGILRIERMAWQYEVTRNYEKILRQQAGDLQAAREIVRLNQQLKSRNDLLYQIFGRYFSDELLEVILEHPEGTAIGGEKRELTVMMADLRGFTSISAELEPEAVTNLLNYYFGKMAEAIARYHGTVIEFLGDAILAVFGAPLPSTLQTDDAIAAAITMQNLMREVNDYCNKQGYPMLEMGIGIHRGEVFIGNIGSEKMMRYNVIGGVVNECSRIESYSVGGQVLVSKETVDTAACPVEVYNQIEITAKGVLKPVPVCEVIGIGGEYQCSINTIEFDVLCPVKEWVLLNLYPIEKKMIKDASVPAHLIQFSSKRAVVELENLDDVLMVYSDVEIFAARQNGKAAFVGVYAKVVEKQDRMITLHFTHVNRGFQDFADQLLSEDKAAGGE